MRNIKNKIKEISKLFICNICNKQFTQPIICFHCEKLYCLNCINNLLNSNCPNCNYKINEENFKPIKIFEEIKNNIEELRNLIKEKEEGEGEKEVNYCYNHPNNKYKYLCLNCDKTYCDECFVFWGKEKNKHYNHDIFKFIILKIVLKNIIN